MSVLRTGSMGLRRVVATVAWVIGAAAVVCAGGAQESFAAEYANISTLEIDAEQFAVEIRSAAGNTVVVRAEEIPDGVYIDDRTSNGRAAVHVRGRSPMFGDHDGDPIMRVTVPTGINLEIETSSGAIGARDVQGILSFRSSSGAIDIRNSGGQVVARSSSGSVQLDAITGRMDVQTSSGAIEARSCRGIAVFETSSGSIQAEDLRLTADAAFSSSSGAIDVDIANDMADLRYDLRSTTGSLEFGAVRAAQTLTGGGGRFLVHGTQLVRQSTLPVTAGGLAVTRYRSATALPGGRCGTTVRTNVRWP